MMTKRNDTPSKAGVPGHASFDPLAKFGVPVEEWLALTQKERDRHHKRFWQKQHSKEPAQKFDPSRHGVTMEEWLKLTPQERVRSTNRANYRSRRKKNPEKLREKWRRDREKNRERIQEREFARYWADPEKRRKHTRDSYWRHHEKRLASYRARRVKQKSISNVRHNPEEVYRRVVAAIPGKLPRFARDDIAGMICLAVLEGKVLVTDIENEVADFMRSYNREYDTFKTLSLDAPVPGMDGMTYRDKLSAGTDDT
jgi:hypothetical protein